MRRYASADVPRAPGIRGRGASATQSRKGILMAKKRDRKGGSQKSKGDAPADGRGLRRHLRRLEKLLAEAAKKEGRARPQAGESAHPAAADRDRDGSGCGCRRPWHPIVDRPGRKGRSGEFDRRTRSGCRARKEDSRRSRQRKRRGPRRREVGARKSAASRQRRWKPTSPRRPPARYRQPSPSLGRHATCPRLAAGRAADPDRSLKLALRDGPPMLP